MSEQPVHIVQVAKAEKIVKVYSWIGRAFLWLVILGAVAIFVSIIVYMFILDFTGMATITAILGAIGLVTWATKPLRDATETLRLAKINGTVDD